MDCKRFDQVFYNLVVITQVVSAQLSDLISEDINTPKMVAIGEFNPVIKFKLGPFESPDDHFYNSDYYLKSVKYNNKKMRERIIELKNGRQSEQRSIGHPGIFKWKNFKGNAGFVKQKHQLDWNQSNRMPINLLNKSSEFYGILVLMYEILSQMKKLKEVSKLLANLRTELLETEKYLTLKSFQYLLNFIEKKFLNVKAENKINMVEKNRFKEINNHTCNIQYQIENLFVLNRLSEKYNSNLKETDVGIINELTACKVKELLEKAVNNLNGNKISQNDVFAVKQSSLQKNQIDFLEQLQKNFLKMFHTQNVTLKHIKQMSKIVDFVERYHGTLSDLKTSSAPINEGKNDGNAEIINEKSNALLQQLLWKRNSDKKVIVEDGFGVFKNEGMEEKRADRKNK